MSSLTLEERSEQSLPGSKFKVSVGSILRRSRGFDDDAGLRPNKCSNEVNPGEVAQTVREIAGTNQVPWLLVLGGTTGRLGFNVEL